MTRTGLAATAAVLSTLATALGGGFGVAGATMARADALVSGGPACPEGAMAGRDSSAPRCAPVTRAATGSATLKAGTHLLEAPAHRHQGAALTLARPQDYHPVRTDGRLDPSRASRNKSDDRLWSRDLPRRPVAPAPDAPVLRVDLP
jgi:hypothetical protein